jgi:hypothetical protein
VSWFCKHDWEKTHTETIPSPMERLEVKAKGVPTDLFQGTFICILTCKKCGAVNKTVAKV